MTTSKPRTVAVTTSALCSKLAIWLDVPKIRYGDKLPIPVPNIMYI